MFRFAAIALIVAFPGPAVAAGYCVMPNSGVKVPFDGHLKHGGRISRLTNVNQFEAGVRELYSIVISKDSGALCVDTYTAEELSELSDYIDDSSTLVEQAQNEKPPENSKRPARKLRKRRRTP